MSEDEIADIKNKLQSCLTMLELLKDGKVPPEDIVKIADDNLQQVILLLDGKQD